MVAPIVNQKLWAFVVARRNSYVVVLVWVVKLSKTPVDKSQVFFLVINNNIKWLHISVHDAVGVTEIKCLHDLVDVQPSIKISEFGKQLFAFLAFHIFVHEARDSGHLLFKQVN